jgi:hypothetical protein
MSSSRTTCDPYLAAVMEAANASGADFGAAVASAQTAADGGGVLLLLDIGSKGKDNWDEKGSNDKGKGKRWTAKGSNEKGGNEKGDSGSDNDKGKGDRKGSKTGAKGSNEKGGNEKGDNDKGKGDRKGSNVKGKRKSHSCGDSGSDSCDSSDTSWTAALESLKNSAGDSGWTLHVP